MYFNSMLRKIINRRILNIPVGKFSTVPEKKVVDQSAFDKYVKELGSLNTVISKNRIKQPQRAPFVKNLFLGKVDTEILAYPELKKKDVDELEAIINILQKIAVQEGEPNGVKDAFHRLKMQKCLGLQCSADISGRELNESEQCRFNEILLNSTYRYQIMNNELCVHVLSTFGTDDQKSRYLQKLLNGEILSTISIANNSMRREGNSLDSVRAQLTHDLASYKLHGKKEHVLGGANADILIVFAQTGDGEEYFSHQNELVGFIVDKDTPGMTIQKIDTDDPSLEGACNIVFNDVIVSKENKLDINQMGKDILINVLPQYHLNNSVINLNMMKKLINSLSEDLLINAEPGEETYKTEAITSRMGEILSHAYMVESMVYFTSGLMSTYENQDCDIESLITRAFSAKLALESSVLGLSLVGISSINSKHFCQQLHKEALTQYSSYENQNMVELTIGFLGIQYSGKFLGDTVKKLRNPMLHGTFILKKLWQNKKQESDNPKMTLDLKHYLHPSCQEAANEIEYCVLRLQYATESLLGKYGIDVLNCHNHVRRLSESIMHIYAMISCLSRASRSYCIGLENNESEMLLANVVCRNSFKRVRSNLNDIIEECLIMDDPMKILSENLYKKKSYYLVNPLSRNF